MNFLCCDISNYTHKPYTKPNICGIYLEIELQIISNFTYKPNTKPNIYGIKLEIELQIHYKWKAEIFRLYCTHDFTQKQIPWLNVKVNWGIFFHLLVF